MYLYKFVFLSSLFVFGFTNLAIAASENITQINFTTAPQTIDMNTISAVISTQTQNASGALEQTSETNHLNFSSTSLTGEFSSSSTNWVPVSTVTMSTGTANKNFYYRDSTAGTHILTVSAAGQAWTQAPQSITIVGAPVVLDSIAITTPATKLSYIVGDTIDIGGLVVTGTYSDSSTHIETVSVVDISGFDSSVAASGQILTININGKNTTYTIYIYIVAPVVVAPVRRSGSMPMLGSYNLNNINTQIVPTQNSESAISSNIKQADSAGVISKDDNTENKIAAVKEKIKISKKVTVKENISTEMVGDKSITENKDQKASALDSVSNLNIWQGIKSFFRFIFK